MAHRRFRKNGRLGNLTVPAGAGGELPLRRVLAQKHPERLRVSADDCLGDDAMRCTKSSAAPFSVAGAARTFIRAFRRCSEDASAFKSRRFGAQHGVKRPLRWAGRWADICREDARADDVVSYCSCAQRAWQAQVMRWSLTIPVACMNA